MAPGHSAHILKVSIAFAIALLVTLLFPTAILPLLPPLRPLASQLFVRLRDVLAFLAFTTAIAAGIFSAQRKDGQSNKENKPFFEHHPLGSIFGEPGHGETEYFHAAVVDDVHAFSLVTKKMEMSNGGDGSDNVMEYSIDRASSAMVNGSLLQKRSTRLAMESSREHKLPISKEDNGVPTEPKVQKKLHRKSSSLDDSVNYEPEVEAALSPESTLSTTSTSVEKKPSKRVSFSMASPPSSSNYESQDESPKQSREDPSEKQRDVSTVSPGDLTRQADAFIAKFKEQIRMQRLESFQRYRRRVA